MYNFIYVFTSFVHIFLSALQLLMLVRAVLSWFLVDDGESRVSIFVHMLTEPAILPVRYVMGALGNFDELPIDIPFFVTMILLTFIQTVLPAVVI